MKFLSVWLYLLVPLISFSQIDSTLIDNRDKTEYSIIKIGDLWWMNENLNYPMPDAFCYDNKTENCEQYGRLYTFDEAMEACPDDWRLPTEKEFEALVVLLEGKKWLVERDFKVKGLWQQWISGNNKAGFKIFPGGLKHKKRFKTLHKSANFWLYDPNKVMDAAHTHMYLQKDKSSSKNMILFWHQHEIHNPIRKKRWFSVRCVSKDR